ncbi:MAG: LysR substrate-binding domain-containing protein [Methylomicrobium sp.]
MDKLTSMNVFVRVAKAGSFAGGARDLDISRAMATKHIMHLESSLGTRLFNRTTRSLSLTEVGASYFERCQQVLLDIEEMESQVTHLQTEPRGSLRISAPPVIGATHIARAISEFLKLHPDLNIELIIQSSPGDMIEDGIDLAIYLGALNDTSMVARKLASSSLVVCGSPTYLAKHGTPQTPQDLAQHSCLINWSIHPKNKWPFKSESGFEVINVTGRLQANVADAIRIAAINDMGLVMLPIYIVGWDIERGRLQPVLQSYPSPPLEVHAVYPHRKYLSAKVRVFMEFLQGWLEPRVSKLEGPET